MRLIFVYTTLIFLTACGPFADKGPITFEEKTNIPPYSINTEQQERLIEQLQIRNKLLKEKAVDWRTIVEEENQDFESLRPLVKKNCFGCHNSDKKLAWYKKMIPSIRKHYNEGIESLDFTNNFPLQAKGNPPQLSLLKAIRHEIVNRTMPLKVYTRVYPFRKTTKKE
jgi:hypothetical protein